MSGKEEGWEKSWEKINNELSFRGGVNPHAYRLGYMDGRDKVINDLKNILTSENLTPTPIRGQEPSADQNSDGL